MDVTVVVGKQGRVVLPAEVRAALGVERGDRLHLYLSGRQLVVQRPEDAVEQLRGLAGIPSGRSLVDELITERRRAAAAAAG